MAKSQYIEGLPKKVKREAWTVYIFSGGGGGGGGKKGGGGFGGERGWCF